MLGMRYLHFRKLEHRSPDFQVSFDFGLFLDWVTIADLQPNLIL